MKIIELLAAAGATVLVSSPAAAAGICLGGPACWGLSCTSDVECFATGICNGCSGGRAALDELRGDVADSRAALEGASCQELDAARPLDQPEDAVAENSWMARR
jgi:hypothetical protein